MEEPSHSMQSSRVVSSGWPAACHLLRHEVQGQRRSSTLRLEWPQAWAETHASSHGPRWAVGPGGAFPRTAPNCKRATGLALTLQKVANTAAQLLLLREFARTLPVPRQHRVVRPTAGAQLKSYTPTICRAHLAHLVASS